LPARSVFLVEHDPFGPAFGRHRIKPMRGSHQGCAQARKAVFTSPDHALGERRDATEHETRSPQIVWAVRLDHAGRRLCRAPMRGAGHFQQGREDLRRRSRWAAREIATGVLTRRAHRARVPGGLATWQDRWSEICPLEIINIVCRMANSIWTTEQFTCASCGMNYNATREEHQDRRSGTFRCWVCDSDVHTWSGNHDFFNWAAIKMRSPVFGKKR